MAVKVYKDPIYDYIEIDADLFSTYIDTPEFQRLQQIRQTSYVPLYSSAVHNRFCHSIGVYYLGKLAIQSFKDNIQSDLRDKIDYKRLLAGISFMEYKQSDGTLKYGLAYKKSSLSALVDVVYAKDFEVEWVQNHPVIVYEQYLDKQVIKSVGEKLFGSVDKLFNCRAHM